MIEVNHGGLSLSVWATSIMGWLNTLPMTSVAGWLAAGLIFVGNGYYLLLTYQKKVKPSLSGIAVFTLSTILGGASTMAKAGVAAGIVAMVGGILNLLIVLTALKTKHHGGWNKTDNWFMSVCMCSAIGWYVFDEAWIALSAAVAIELIGYTAVFKKMYVHPAQESPFTWAIAGVAYGLPVLAYAQQASMTWLFMAEHSFALFNAVLCLAVCGLDVLQKRVRRDTCSVGRD